MIQTAFNEIQFGNIKERTSLDWAWQVEGMRWYHLASRGESLPENETNPEKKERMNTDGVPRSSYA